MTFGRLWSFLAIALPVLAGLLASMSTVDLAYHLRAGGEFLDSGVIATRDTWTHTAAGAPWLNQQWLAQVVLALVHRLGGFELLVVLRAALIGAIFGLILLACRLRGAPPRTAALLTLGAFGLSAAALGLRPQLFGMLCFAAVLAVVADRARHPGRLWAVPLLVALWANLHGSFFLGPAVLGIAWLEDLHDRRPAGRTLLITLVAAAAAVVNPFGPAVWAYAVGLSTNPQVTSQITEWQPTSLRSVIGIGFFVSALAVAALLARRPQRAPWPTLLWLGFLFAIGVYAIRGVAWWPLGAAVVVAGLLDPARAGAPAPAPAGASRPSRLNSVVAGLLVVVGAVLLPWWRPPGSLLLEAPTAVSEALRDVDGEVRLFHPQQWGSWIEFAAPDARTFVDSRIELFEPAVWDDYAAIAEGRADWAAILDRRGVNVVVADERLADLGDRLAGAPGWALVEDVGEVRIFRRT